MAKILAGLLVWYATTAWGGGIEGTCSLRFLATSTLHDVSGTGRCLPFTAEMASGISGKTMIPEVNLEVPVEGMDTHNDARNGQMRKMFDSDRYPKIRGTIRKVDVKEVRDAVAKDGEAVIDLYLRIRDIERRIPVVVTDLQQEGDRVRFAVEFSLSLANFGLEPPSLLFFIRVGDKVIVKGNFELTVTS